MTAATADHALGTGPRARPEASFRPDVEGLRAIAVLSVLIYHAGLVWIPGAFVGVDIFFVISGFLITSLMVRGIERNGRLRMADFWARRARRLLPASTLVLAFSAVVALLCLPVTSRRPFGGDIVSAAFYVVNWRLACREVDYLTQDVGPSPVQHYWSLAVEEQFYVIWPVLIALLVWTFRRRWRAALLVGVAALTLASFAFSLYYSVEQPGLAFFVSTTRIWELGVGALMAIAFPTLVRAPAAVRWLLGWGGLVALGLSLVVIDDSTVWPGTATLLPVLGTASVILAGGGTAVRASAGRLLGIRPAVVIGGLSYSLYLWHWPFLVGAEGLWGHLQVRYALLVVLASAVPAWLSFRYVENPMRRAPRLAAPRRAFAMGAAGMAVASVAGLAVVASFSLVDTVGEASAAEAIGARALDDPAQDEIDWAGVDTVEEMRPSPLKAAKDLPAIHDSPCIVGRDEDDFQVCEYGETGADRTVVLAGDSKAAQWFTPVERIARQAGWRLVVILKNGCEFADAVRLVDEQRNRSCEDWAPRALDTIVEMRPDVVLTVTRFASALRPEQAGRATSSGYTVTAMADGLARYWQRVIDAGATVVPILDSPGPTYGSAPDCVQEHLDDLSACAYSRARADAVSGAPAARQAAKQVPEARVIDMSRVLCPDGERCPAVIGNVLVYRAGTHLSDTYAASTTSALGRELAKATNGALGRG